MTSRNREKIKGSTGRGKKKQKKKTGVREEGKQEGREGELPTERKWELIQESCREPPCLRVR